MKIHPEQISALVKRFQANFGLSERDARRVAIGTLKQEAMKPSKIAPIDFEESYKSQK
jgi:hypothetical protein|tara:strand:- start:407 stop:580 length:174 start_codon:yes stop_codon:yes gene_type:complete